MIACSPLSCGTHFTGRSVTHVHVPLPPPRLPSPGPALTCCGALHHKLVHGQPIVRELIGLHLHWQLRAACLLLPHIASHLSYSLPKHSPSLVLPSLRPIACRLLQYNAAAWHSAMSIHACARHPPPSLQMSRCQPPLAPHPTPHPYTQHPAARASLTFCPTLRVRSLRMSPAIAFIRQDLPEPGGPRRTVKQAGLSTPLTPSRMGISRMSAPARPCTAPATACEPRTAGQRWEGCAGQATSAKAGRQTGNKHHDILAPFLHGSDCMPAPWVPTL